MSTTSFLHPHPHPPPMFNPFSTPTRRPLLSTRRPLRPMNSLPSPSPSPSPRTNPTTLTLLNSLTKFIWGKSLPPQLLISTVRSTWHSVWLLMMSQLAPSDPSTGGYSRPPSQFRANRNDISRLNPTALHLYAALPCPWAHRTLIVRALKGLEDVIPISIAAPGIDGLWVFINGPEKLITKEVGSSDPDRLVPGKDNANGCRTVKEVYRLRSGGYDGRSTVPMLWDVQRKEVVCNESYDIIQLLNSEFNEVAGNPKLDLEPPALKERIEEWNRVIYPNVNNGVYRCGFAQTQEAYDAAVNDLFDTLDILEDHLRSSRYLCGDSLTLADVCLFTTLIRFDLVYNVMFKCTKRKLVEYPNLHGYMRDIYQIPKVAQTCNLEAMMDGYYKFLFPLNPGNIRPIIPSACQHEALSRPHSRDSLSSTAKSMQVSPC